MWNSLPDELRSTDITLTSFRNKLFFNAFVPFCCILQKCAL